MKIESPVFPATPQQWLDLGWKKFTDEPIPLNTEDDHSDPVWAVQVFDFTWRKPPHNVPMWKVSVMIYAHLVEGYAWCNCRNAVLDEESEWDDDYDVLYWKPIEYPVLPKE